MYVNLDIVLAVLTIGLGVLAGGFCLVAMMDIQDGYSGGEQWAMLPIFGTIAVILIATGWRMLALIWG